MYMYMYEDSIYTYFQEYLMQCTQVDSSAGMECKFHACGILLSTYSCYEVVIYEGLQL